MLLELLPAAFFGVGVLVLALAEFLDRRRRP
jgi:hypothetical protein